MPPKNKKKKKKKAYCIFTWRRGRRGNLHPSRLSFVAIGDMISDLLIPSDLKTPRCVCERLLLEQTETVRPELEASSLW